MSMTREEAIKLLKQYQGYEPMFPDGETQKHAFDLTDETVDTLLTALRPVSRERVEKVWRGNWKKDSSVQVLAPGGQKYHFRCSKCGYITRLHDLNFCSECGTPMTDEAVEMVMERINEMEGTENGLG